MVKKISTRKQSASEIQQNTPGIAIVEWLSYAFWGWVILFTTILIGIATDYAFNGYSSVYSPVSYVIAAALVLLPFAVIADVLFSRHERNRKVSAGAVIMVIHAVLFTLLAVAALATTVFSLVNLSLSINPADTTGAIVTAITAFSAVVLYGLLSIRTIRPMVTTRFRRSIRIVLGLIVAAVVIWGIAGPAAQTFIRKDDDRAKLAAQSLDSFIGFYVSRYNVLPIDVDQAIEADTSKSLGESEPRLVRSAVDDGLVRYVPNTKPSTNKPVEGSSDTENSFYYQLCVTFKYDDEHRDDYGSFVSADSDGYAVGLSSLSTKAGETCYDQKAVFYGELKAL